MDGTVELHALILAGGSGTRFWPQGRRAFPKFLLPLAPGGATLLYDTVERVAAVTGIGRVHIITGADQGDAVQAAVPQLEPSQILREPAARDTAAAIAWGVSELHRTGVPPEAAVACLPADAYIRDRNAFAAALTGAATLALHSDTIVTFGIPPTRPATGYGYIHTGPVRDTTPLGEAWPAGLTAHNVRAFVEKPDSGRAKLYLDSGGYLWNSGMFIAPVGRMWIEVQTHLPDLAAAVSALPAPDADDFGAAFGNLPKTSIDYGVMEKTAHVSVMTVAFDWSDVGSWAAVHELQTTAGAVDAHGNVVGEDCLAPDTFGSWLQTDTGVLAVIGMTDVVVVRHGNAVLVCPRERSEEVKRVVEHLRDAGRTDVV